MSSVHGASQSSRSMYLTQALEAMTHVKNMHYTSSNRGKLLDGLEEEASGAMGKTSNETFSAVYSDMIGMLGGKDEHSSIMHLLAPVVAANRHRFANCEARAGLAFLFLAKDKAKPVECFALHNEDADHVFLLLNRAQGSKRSDYKDWGPDAVICDPWAEEVYMASELTAKITTEEKYKEVKGKGELAFYSLYENTTGESWPPNDPSVREICKKYADDLKV
jgi:hypothetical protein